MKTSPEYAIFLCGNAGVGKSTLSSTVGANFESGFSFGEGLTKDVSTAEITLINGDRVLIIDAPGMYEASKENTKANAREVQKALGYDLPYKVAFVVSSNSGRWLAQDVAIIDKVVEAVRSSDGSIIEYVLIINQIHKEHWDYYVGSNNKLDIIVSRLYDATQTKPKFSAVLCFPHVSNPKENIKIAEKLLEGFKMTVPTVIELVKNIEADPDDLKLYQKLLIAVLSPVWIPVGLVVMVLSSIKNKIKYDDWEPFRDD